VYIITQNALADGTYLNYIRAHYNRSAQVDPPFLRDAVLYLQTVVMGKQEAEKRIAGQPYRLNGLAKAVGSLTNLVTPFDRLITSLGQKVEDRRRRQGVYPPEEILTASVEDSQKAFQDYIVDAQRRFYHDSQYPNEPKQIRPGEVVNFTPDGRVQVNGLLTKIIFDKNPTNDFYVEESFPLEWMFPHLTPYGIIMKINREPVAELTEEMLAKDHEFWSRYADRLCGNWITYDTPIKEISDFAERVYLRGNLRGYTGDAKFVRDNDAQKAFSKLRNSIAGMYAWRLGPECPPELRPQTVAVRDRLVKEADFAFKQAFAFCPYSPETVTRYATLLASLGRVDDALLIAETSRQFDPESPFAASIVDQLRQMKQGMASLSQLQGQVATLEHQYRTNTNNLQAAFNLVAAYLQLQQTNPAFEILDGIVARSNADVGSLVSVARAYVEIGHYARSEPALRRLVAQMPDSPEIWYDLAGSQTALGKSNEAVRSLATAIELSGRRLASDPKASNLQALAVTDGRFQPLHSLPEFRKLVAPK
jgi:thioredoxin-like negative regulator of GroEL